jgi:hypothetical protein
MYITDGPARLIERVTEPSGVQNSNAASGSGSSSSNSSATATAAMMRPRTINKGKGAVMAAP